MLLLASVLNFAVGAPAVSSVHVRFVSGNKATQYSHELSGDGTSTVQHNLVGAAAGKLNMFCHLRFTTATSYYP